ncbi:MAG TPA: alcohol dehydrogenase catalytic domain-containing protein [Bryobacterales bacterium]|nr:alcohol dehydrogenase catalytic domain-containing protein [Bryobacterales bacterium]
MQSVQLVARERVELRAMPDPPDPGPGEVTVRVRAVGLCGSDMHFYKEGGCAGYPALYPSVLGHEPAGEVIAVGPGVEDLRAGARVAIEPAITCGACEFCRAGRHNLCEQVVFMGGLQVPGLLRELATIPARNATAIPDSIGYAAATVIEPLAVILHAFELTRIEAGETVAVMGAGPIGLLAAAVARIAGAGRVIVADRIAYRLALAREMGADAVVDIAREKPAEAILDLTGGRGAHLILDAAGKPDSINPALASVRPGGRVLLIGIPSEAMTGLDLHAAMNREAALLTLKRSNRNDHAALGLIESGRVAAEKLVTHRFPLDRAGRAFQTVAEYADGVAKAVIEL